jgi:hypothetical protein
MTGAQLIEWMERRETNPLAPFTHVVRDAQLLVGEDGELIESDSAVPPKRDER